MGVCALDSKARSKPSRNILNRINARNEFDIIIFGDKIILDEAPENWPICDYLISFFSDGFPLDKAISYVRLRKPFCINDLPMQMCLWDRRMCLAILDKYNIPTPQRLEVSRDGGATLPSQDAAQHVFERTGVRIRGPDEGLASATAAPSSVYMLDHDTLCVDGETIKKPFVEKPVSGEDHNINIYYSEEVGGGGRRLFRKINNKSSDADETLNVPRAVTDTEGSYVFESFLSTDNHEDVKAYTVGPTFCHAETRKSPVVDGIVKRNTHGKEMRYVTSLTDEESIMAAKISEGFGQRVCGFDLLRTGNQSFVIDVNGWSFVKDNNGYYERCSQILKDLFVEEKNRKEGRITPMDDLPTPEDLPHRHGPSNHFSLKSIFKSPSMSRLAGHHHPGGRHGRDSPDSTAQTIPLTSPPSIERPAAAHLPPATIGQESGPVSAAAAAPLPASDEPTPAETPAVPLPASKAQWRLKGMVAVIRHADRTPKQKFKFTFHSKHFVDLLKGHREEVLLIGEVALDSVMDATNAAIQEGQEDLEKLKLLRTSLMRKGSWAGTKVQIKPMFRKKKTGTQTPSPEIKAQEKEMSQTTDDQHTQAKPIHGGKRQDSLTGVTLSRDAAAEDNLELEKLQLIIKWGGEPTHSARYQSQELGENMRNDLLLMNRDALEDVSVFSSSERRVTTSAHIWTSAFLNQNEIPPDCVKVRKDLLDDSNAAKDEMDKVKKKLKGLLRQGNKAPPQFAWPENMPEPFIVVRNVVALMTFHQKVMRHNFEKLNNGTATLSDNIKSPPSTSRSVSPNPPPGGSMAQAATIHQIQNRWCSGEDAELFKERWEKLFKEFKDPEKVDPSKISELHDTMKFDAIHNRPFLEWIFAPTPDMVEEFVISEAKRNGVSAPPPKTVESSALDSVPEQGVSRRSTSTSVRMTPNDIVQRMGLRRTRGEQVDANTARNSAPDAAAESYFTLFKGVPGFRSKTDQRLEKLRELFLLSKVLFDFIGPQEYGIMNSEKLEIGLLTSLPLLRAIVHDLEDVQASENAKTCVYFTKESHIYTLLNCIIEGGIETKIERNKIPELDYLSTIGFELYESANSGADESAAEDQYNYSIRITISPGCHAFEPLDVQLDSKHCIGFAPRRTLTPHQDWKYVIETLRAKFHTVKLPKSFVAVNLAEKAPQAFSRPGTAANNQEDKTPQIDLAKEVGKIVKGKGVATEDRTAEPADLSSGKEQSDGA